MESEEYKKYERFGYCDPIPQLIECGLLAYEADVTDHSMKLICDTVSKFFEENETEINDKLGNRILEFCENPIFNTPPDEFILTDKILRKAHDFDETLYLFAKCKSCLPENYERQIEYNVFVKIFENDEYLNQFRYIIWRRLLYYLLKERINELNSENV